MSAILEFDGVTKDYTTLWPRKTVRALDEFSLTVERGEVFGFLGPNGAGKTTAIHMALGFTRPSRGRGRLLQVPFGNAKARRRVGFVPENVAMYHRPVRKLVRFYGALNGLRDPRLARATRIVLETMELDDVVERNAGKLSRGMLQRVALAQALVNDPDLLLLDEPTSALDPLGRVAVRELLQQARAAGKTVFLSSHLLSEIETVCDRVAIIHRGRLRRIGRTHDLLESAEQVEIIARGVPPSAFSGANAVDGLVRFVVPVARQRDAIERVWSGGGEVVRLNPLRRSLEDMFLEIVGEKPGGGGA